MSIEEALKLGYTDVKYVSFDQGHVLCGLFRYAFTTGLVFNIQDNFIDGRWCFDSKKQALEALERLNHIPEDLMIEGNWIKFKGFTEIVNPKYNKDENDNDGIAPQLLGMLRTDSHWPKA